MKTKAIRKDGEKRTKEVKKTDEKLVKKSSKSASGGKPGIKTSVKRVTKESSHDASSSSSVKPVDSTGEVKRPIRRQRTAEEIENGITVSDITRLARRAGVLRMSRDVYAMTRRSLRRFLEEIVKDAILYMETTRGLDEPGGTISAKHVTAALRNNNQTVWGFD